jgi:hypothetical protein
MNELNRRVGERKLVQWVLATSSSAPWTGRRVLLWRTSGLADAHAVLGCYYHLPPVEAFPAAREAARRALEIDPDLAQAHATLGYVALYHDWDWERADEAAPRRGWRPPRRRASVVRASSQDA